ncbi:DUF6387 family protein [Enterobacter ludwigii]|uniref:DUF6387 family protein n=1 Tax=Enterobacter ludwigii TaxID=299767 RepID=UPI003BEEB484
MKKISSTRDLPKEFNLNKYENLNAMEDKGLFRQVYLRHEPYHDSKNTNVNWDYDCTTYYMERGGSVPLSFEQGDPFKEIKLDEPPDNYEWMKGGRDFYNKYMENCKKSLKVSTGYGIGYLSREVLMYFSVMNDAVGERKGLPIVIDDDEFHHILEEQSNPEVDGLLRARLNDSVTMLIDDERLYLSIDVSTPDELLISEFKRLIPIWRKELKIERSLSVNSSWNVVRKKIIDYKVIPYIDLIIWANANKVSIPNGIMAVALFPHGERDLFSITQTIRPFVESLMAYDSLEKMKQEISKQQG